MELISVVSTAKSRSSRNKSPATEAQVQHRINRYQKLNIIIGPNGIGKTRFLESVHLGLQGQQTSSVRFDIPDGLLFRFKNLPKVDLVRNTDVSNRTESELLFGIFQELSRNVSDKKTLERLKGEAGLIDQILLCLDSPPDSLGEGRWRSRPRFHRGVVSGSSDCELFGLVGPTGLTLYAQREQVIIEDPKSQVEQSEKTLEEELFPEFFDKKDVDFVVEGKHLVPLTTIQFNLSLRLSHVSSMIGLKPLDLDSVLSDFVRKFQEAISLELFQLTWSKYDSWFETYEFEETELYFVDNLAKAAIACAQKEIERNLPDFVSDFYSLHINVPKPGDHNQNLSLRVSEKRKPLLNGKKLPKDAGQAVERWLSVALQLSSDLSRLGSFQWRVPPEDILARQPQRIRGIELDDGKSVERMDQSSNDLDLFESLGNEEWQKIEFVPEDSARIILIDEPESGLHPTNIMSVKRWIQNQASTSAAVFVSTHSPQIFDLQYPSVSRFIANGEGAGLSYSAKLRLVDKDVSRLPSSDLEQVGISKSENYMFFKSFLMVEGLADYYVLNAWYSDLFDKEGVKVFNCRGDKVMPKLMDFDFVLDGIAQKILIFMDSPAPQGTSTDEELIYNDLLRGYLKSSIQNSSYQGRFSIATHGEWDIFFHLDPSLVREVIPKFNFETWQAARAEFEEFVAEKNRFGTRNGKRHREWLLCVTDFKDWLEQKKIKLPTRDILRIAELQKEQGLIPKRLSEDIGKLVASLGDYSVSDLVNKEASQILKAIVK